MNLRENVQLAPFTTFCIGGEAAAVAMCATTRSLEEAISFAKGKGLPLLVLGGGSNVLADDARMDAVFVRPQFRGIEQKAGELVVGAGESWDSVVEFAVEAGLWGIENLSGIPGEVGGACVQNIGAYGAALSNTLSWIEVFDTKEGAVRTLTRAMCGFGYRDSIFKQNPGRFIIMRAALALVHSGRPEFSYKDLAELFKDRVPDAQEVRGAVLSIRAHKFPDLTKEGTAGSFFKNPTLRANDAARLQEQFPGLPIFSLPESDLVKIPLAWFLDARNGVFDFSNLQIGGARLFERQPLVVAAAFGTKAQDVRALAREIAGAVHRKLGITIEPEVCIVRKNQFTNDIFN